MNSLRLISILSACGWTHALAHESMQTHETMPPLMLDDLVVYAEPIEYPELEKPFTLTEPFADYTLSRLGSPYIYAFTARPAFTGQDFFLNYTYRESDHSSVQKYAVEINWALTQQIGLFAEIPYLTETSNHSIDQSGLGNLALVPRASVLETDRFLIALQTELESPIGNHRINDETTIAPGVAVWTDLGLWFTLHSEIAVEHGLNTDASRIAVRIALIKSMSGKYAHSCVDGDCDHGGDISQFNYHLELSGDAPIHNDERNEISLEGLIGISYNISEKFDIRAGYLFPIKNNNAFHHGFTTGLISQF